MSISNKLVLTYAETCELLHGIHKGTLSRWIREGKIRPIEGTRFFSRAEVERFAGILDQPKTPEQRKRGRYNKEGTRV